MTLDWQHFTPWTSLAGGMLIGAAAALLIIFNGRVAGISGIVGTLIDRLFVRATASEDRSNLWRCIFIAGLLLAAPLWSLVQALPAVSSDAGTITLVIAGLLTGIGTRYASGCTSGHGVCGLSRGSLRSLVATLTFMGTGFATVYLMHHVWSA